MSAASVFPLHPMRTAEPFPSLLHTRFQGRVKRGRGKAVSWPPEDQICQIRFFLSNDAPSSLGSAQPVFQSNHSKSLSTQSSQSRYLDGSLDVPPGFHGSIAKRAKVNTVLEVSMSVGMPWFCPQKFFQECDWLVGDGDESKETGLQKQRELRVLEAFYPRLTSIPDSPAEPVECGKCLDDNLVPIISLVAIEEEDESAQGPDHGVKEEFELHMAAAEHGKLNDEQMPQLPTSGCLTGSHEEPTIIKMDPKVAAAAAAAAACMAMHKLGANGLVDQELLVEILRNPALLKNLTFLNASSKDLAGPMNGNEIGIVGQPIKNPHIFKQCAAPLNKGCQGTPFNTGLPSPVSVLSDWTQEHSSKFLSRTPSNLSDISDTSNVKNVSPCMPPSLPFRHSNSTYPSRENVARMESVSVPLQGVHAYAQETGLGMKASHISNNASAQTAPIVHVDRSCGMVAPLTPFPSQNMVNFNSSVHGRMRPAQMSNAAAQIGVMHDSAPCRSSFADARLRSLQNENPALGSMGKIGPKTTRLCMYFNTPRGCRNGGSCAFLHQLANEELNPTAQ